MRKYLLTSLIVLAAMPGASWAANHCMATICNWNGDAADGTARLLTTDGEEITSKAAAKSARDAKKRCFKCDYDTYSIVTEADGCDAGTIAAVNTYSLAAANVYKCQAGGEWKRIESNNWKLCPKSPIKKLSDGMANYSFQSASPLKQGDDYLVAESMCVYGECVDDWEWNDTNNACTYAKCKSGWKGTYDGFDKTKVCTKDNELYFGSENCWFCTKTSAECKKYGMSLGLDWGHNCLDGELGHTVEHGEQCWNTCTIKGKFVQYVETCEDGYIPGGDTVDVNGTTYYTQCVPDPNAKKTKPEGEKKDNKEQQTKIPCKEQRKGNPEGMACCDVKDATWKNNKCVCNDKNKEFVFGNGKTPACVVKTKPNDQGAKDDNGGNAGQTTPPAKECKGYPTEDFSKWVESYVTPYENKKTEEIPEEVSNIKKAIDDIKENCDDKKITDEEYKKKYDALKKQIQDYNEKLEKLAGAVNEANQGLWSLISADRSVWRDKEGNINKARLASDGVGAVVLGTTSALITGHVMKKKQVEKGMDSIRCVVGGQVVADWGDDFVIKSEY